MRGDGPSIVPEHPLQFDRLQHLRGRHDNGAKAAEEKQLSAKAGILRQIGLAALCRTQSQRIGDKEDLGLGFDLEEACEFFRRLTRVQAKRVPVQHFQWP